MLPDSIIQRKGGLFYKNRGGGGHIFNKTVTFEKRGNDWGNESVKSKKEEKDKGFDKHVKEEKCFVDLSAVFLRANDICFK